MQNPYERLWDAVAYCEGRAWDAWRKEHTPSLTFEGTLTQRLRSIETTVQRRPGCNSLVTVSFLARRAFECEVYVFHLQRAGNRWFVNKDSV